MCVENWGVCVDVVDVVDERRAEDDDGMEQVELGESSSSYVVVGRVDSLLRDVWRCGLIATAWALGLLRSYLASTFPYLKHS